MPPISFANCKVERSTDGAVWSDIRARAASVTVGGGERQMGEFFNFSLDVPQLVRGKRSAIDLTTRVLYTEGAGEDAEVARVAYETPSDFYLRWSPGGGDPGDFLYTSDVGTITNPPYPQGEAGSPDPVTLELNIKTAKITKSVVV